LPAVAPAPLFQYEKWGPLVRHLAKQYQSATPFAHIQLAPFLEAEMAQQLASDFPDLYSSEWIHYKHANENKLGLTQRALFPKSIGAVVDELNSAPFVAWLRELTGIPDIFADPSLEGGGLHQSEIGGFLNIHTDFSVHHHRPDWERRVNLILYLNTDWQDSWGGALEFWDENMKQRAAHYFPRINHAVIFNTGEKSLHGFPVPLRCPPGVARKSLALYYYSPRKMDSVVHATKYRPRPGDGLKKSLMIHFDTYVLDLYSRAKRRLRFSDRAASNLLRILAKLRPH